MPPPDRWQALQDQFEDLVDLPPGERRARLDALQRQDAALHDEVVSLLDAYERADSVLGLFEPPGELRDPAEDYLDGAVVGPYRIEREIGRGGMGTVYLAERADGHFARRVALKLVKRGMDTDEVLRRFRYERQILAGLEHPHIARLYDGGVSSDGRPYLAMEYVDGVPIDRYCDARTFSVEARLGLFTTVCEAVRYAHHNLVIHRDLKPSNILVTEDGQVKLLDFGIAKLLAEEANATAPVTRTGARILTPAYASPEQLQGRAVTTATDTYALGVILYELLTGRRPFDSGQHGQAGTAPERPSETVTRPFDPGRHGETTETITPEQISAARATSPERLQRRLRGDLDTIVLKALRPEPERRYQSAEQFLDDVKRHLVGLPVAARPDTLGYRSRKFVRRHRFGVAASAIALILTLAFAVLYTVRVTHERNIAQQERTNAQQERDKAEEVTAFLEGLFRASDPFAGGSERLDTLRIRDFVSRGVESVQHDLDGQPAMQAQMLNTLGNVYRNLGLYEEARPLLEQALTLRRTAFGLEHAEVAHSLHTLGTLLDAQNAFDEAEPLLRKALSMRQATLSHDHPDVAVTMNNLAELLRKKNELEAADSLYREAITIQRRVLGKHEETARTLNNLGLLLLTQGDLDAAEPLLQESLAMRRSVLGNAHPDVAVSLNNLAGLSFRRGDMDGAITLLHETLAIQRAVLGDEHPDVAVGLNNLAGLLMRTDRYDEAEPLFRESLAINRKLLGDEHPRVANTLGNLAELLRLQEKYEEAEPLFRKALAMRRAALGPEHPAVARTLNNLGLLYMESGDFSVAEPLFRESLAIRRAALAPDHPEVATGVLSLADLLQRQERYPEAEFLLLESLEALDGKPDLPARQQLRQALASLYDTMGDVEQAAKYRAELAQATS